MIKLKSKADLYKLDGMATEIRNEAKRIAEILDEKYN